MEGDGQEIRRVSLPLKVGGRNASLTRSREVVYNQEDDDHLPTLTVAQTLRFALSTKTPKKKIPGMSNAQFREEVLQLLLSMLNIKHTANTIVSLVHLPPV